MQIVEGQVFAHYGQIELSPGESGSVPPRLDLGLVHATTTEYLGYVTLLVPEHTATVTVRCELHDGPPPPKDWECAVEFSVRTGDLSAFTGELAVVCGWAGGGSVTLDLPPNTDIRVRYSVPDGQAWSDAEAAGVEGFPGVVLFQLWPAPPSEPAILASRVPWSQYWTLGVEAVAVAAELAGLREDERLLAAVDTALRRHPEIAARIATGDTRYHLGVIRYAQQAVTDHGDPEALERLIDARARALNAGG